MESWQNVIEVSPEVTIRYPASEGEKRELRRNERAGDAKETADATRWNGGVTPRIGRRSASVYLRGKLVGIWDSKPIPDCDEIPGGAPHMRIWGYLSHTNADAMKVGYVRYTRAVFEAIWKHCEGEEIRAAIVIADGSYTGAIKWIRRVVGNVVSDQPAQKLEGYRVIVFERPLMGKEV